MITEKEMIARGGEERERERDRQRQVGIKGKKAQSEGHKE